MHRHRRVHASRRRRDDGVLGEDKSSERLAVAAAGVETWMSGVQKKQR